MPTALIVEDEPEANKLLAMLVQLRGYQTESALDGAQAMDHLRKRTPDVIFLDLMLPDVDGYDICRSLKSSEHTSQVPVIIVTARITDANRIESFRAGADNFIPKPYTPDEIFEALEQAQAWKAQLESSRIDGEASLDGRDEGETLRSLARLRNATPLSKRPGRPDDRGDRSCHRGHLVECARLGAIRQFRTGCDPQVFAQRTLPDVDRRRRKRLARKPASARGGPGRRPG